MAMNPVNLQIDRLVLDIPGNSADFGKQVATLVSTGLAAALPQAGDLPSLRIAIQAEQADDPAGMANRIIAETLRALARSL